MRELADALALTDLDEEVWKKGGTGTEITVHSTDGRLCTHTQPAVCFYSLTSIFLFRNTTVSNLLTTPSYSPVIGWYVSVSIGNAAGSAP